MKNKKVSIILPCHNEELSISDTLIKISNLLINKCHFNNFQIFAIDDGSTDNTWKIIDDLSKKNNHVIGFKLKKNYGKDIAITNSLKEINSDIYIVMDSDGEHPIDKIELMLSKFDENKILIGLRENNKSLIKNLISIFYKTLLSLATGYKIPQNSTDFVCFSNSIKIKLFNHFNKILYFKSVFFFLDEKIEYFNFYSNKNLNKKRSSFTLYRLIDVFFTTLTFYCIRPIKISQILAILLTFLIIFKYLLVNVTIIQDILDLCIRLILSTTLVIFITYLKNLYEILQIKKDNIINTRTD